MSMADPPNGDPLERNLDELLMRAEPAPTFPTAAKEKILARLLEAGKEKNATVERGIRRRPLALFGTRAVGWATAAVLLLLVLVFWPELASEGVVWADVQVRLAAARSFTAESRSVQHTEDGREEVIRALLFFQDPGRSRTERFAVGGEEEAGAQDAADVPLSVEVLVRELDRARQISLFPGRGEARVVTHRFEGKPSSSRPLVDLAAEGWKRLVSLQASGARDLGERAFDDLRLVGFEAPIGDLFDGLSMGVAEGEIRVWVSPETAEPRRVELEYRRPGGTSIQTTISGIEWDVPLDPGLFEPDVPSGWKMERVERTVRGFDRAGLAVSTALTIGPQAGEPLTTAGDLVAVVEGEQIADLDPAVPPRMVVTFELTQVAAKRLAAYSEKHPDQLLVADFDGEALGVPRWQGVPGRIFRLDLSRLEMSLAEFERRYLERRD